jgi:hypothetical protein
VAQHVRGEVVVLQAGGRGDLGAPESRQ